MNEEQLTPEQYIALAYERLGASRSALDNGFYRDTCSGAYYAAFNAVCGALAARELAVPKTHKGANIQFHRHIVNAGLIDPDISDYLSKTENARLVADYSGKLIDADEAGKIYDMAEKIVTTIESELEQMIMNKKDSEDDQANED